MNGPYVYALLIAATEQPQGFKLYGKNADHQVRQMVEAGLVEATLNDGTQGSFTINRVLEAGHTFLRTFSDPELFNEPLIGTTATPSQTALLKKWMERLT